MLIQRMRDGSEGVLAKVIIGLIVIVFAMFGFGSITTFLAPVPKIATVNGEDISQQEMEMSVERNRRMLLARDVPADQIDEDELRENVLNSLISREILTQATNDLGLHFSDAALDQGIVANDVFMLDGVFNADQFQRVIGGAGYSPLSYRAEMRTDKLFDQMLTGIRQSAFLTEVESKRYGALLSQQRDVAYLRIAVTDLLDDVTISEEDIDEYYASNSQDFVTDEMVNLQYVELKREDLAESIDVDEAELLQYFEDHKGDYSTDETRRVAHILLEVSEDVSMEDAMARAKAVHDRIKNGEDFSALAMEISDDFGSRENGGDLGFNEQGTFFPEFEAVAYDLSLNQVSEPVQTEIGVHIIKVLDIQEATVATLDDVRAEIEQSFRLAATEDEFVTTSSRLAELLFENFSELESTASGLGLEVKTTGQLKRDASHVLMSNTRVAAAAFSPDVLLDGNNSDLIEISEDHHLGLRVLEHLPSASKPLETVKEDIRYILQRLQAVALVETRAGDIVTAIDGGSLAQYVADEYDLEWEVVPGASRFNQTIEPFILSEAFRLPRPAEDKESLGFSSLPNGDGVVLRVSAVTNKAEIELGESELAGVRSNLSRQLGLNDFQDFQGSLREEADIEGLN